MVGMYLLMNLSSQYLQQAGAACRCGAGQSAPDQIHTAGEPVVLAWTAEMQCCRHACCCLQVVTSHGDPRRLETLWMLVCWGTGDVWFEIAEHPVCRALVIVDVCALRTLCPHE